MTKGVAPLWELAVCLRDGVRGLTHAMAMDGGDSSDLLIGSELAGNRPNAAWQPLVEGKGLSHVPLPTVIGVFPRR
jgi:thiamine biosynthesis protein ThiC